MNKHDAKKAVEKLAKADLIALTKHARERGPALGKFPLTREQIKNCLINGVITEGPSPDIKEVNGWKMTITRLRESEKHEVSCVLIVDQSILVITGYEYQKRQR